MMEQDFISEIAELQLKERCPASRRAHPALLALMGLGCTASLVARAMGVSPSQVGAWVGGWRSVPDQHVSILLHLLGEAVDAAKIILAADQVATKGVVAGDIHLLGLEDIWGQRWRKGLDWSNLRSRVSEAEAVLGQREAA